MDQEPIISELVNEYEAMAKTERILQVNVELLNTRKKKDFSLYLLCLNCQNHIKVVDSDEHSDICIVPTDSVRSLDKKTDVEQIKFKLFRLKNLFERTMREREYKGVDVLSLNTMMELTQKICEEDRYCCDQQSLEKLKCIINKNDEDAWVLLLAERLYSLLSLLKIFNEDCEIERLSFESQSLKYDNEILELKKKVDMYKRRSIALHNICKKKSLII